ncbi:hypothetical protein G6F68_011308 [Rhizopus microsporus]|nr:hypothetical protein G6F68_011308 [Rhizopus microsporus]
MIALAPSCHGDVAAEQGLDAAQEVADDRARAHGDATHHAEVARHTVAGQLEGGGDQRIVETQRRRGGDAAVVGVCHGRVRVVESSLLDCQPDSRANTTLRREAVERARRDHPTARCGMALSPYWRDNTAMTDRIPLLLLPGLLNDAELWRAQLADLADIADCTVGDQTRGETLQAVAEDVLAQAPERFALAGFSLGGFVAQQILRIAPERVLQLALIDTSIHADSPERAEQRRSQRASVRLPGKFHGFGDALMRSYIDASRLDDYVLVQRVRDMTARLGAEVFLRQSALERRDGHDVLASYRDPERGNARAGAALAAGGGARLRAPGADGKAG